jgi:hypothetical protein
MSITANCLVNEPSDVDPEWAVAVRQAHAWALARLSREDKDATEVRMLHEALLVHLTRIVQLTEASTLTDAYVVGVLDMVYTLVALGRHDEAAAAMWALHDRIAAEGTHRYNRYYTAMKSQIATLAQSQDDTSL